MQRASGYERTAREMLTALTLTLHDTVDAARSLVLVEKNLGVCQSMFFYRIFFL